MGEGLNLLYSFRIDDKEELPPIIECEVVKETDSDFIVKCFNITTQIKKTDPKYRIFLSREDAVESWNEFCREVLRHVQAKFHSILEEGMKGALFIRFPSEGVKVD